MRYDLLKVLLVDDNRHARLLLAEILRAVGVRAIYEASDGVDGLKLMEASPIDVVFTDLSMQPMDGLDFVKLLRTSPDSPNQFAPVIMITGHATASRLAEARDVGVTEFMAKPFNARTVLQRLHLAVEHPRPFVRHEAFVGPDRRRRVEPPLQGRGRRGADRMRK